MRALVIGASNQRSAWLGLLAAGRFDVAEAASAVDALQWAGPVGVDLIVLAGETGVIGAAEFASLVRRGVFGASPPPLIVQLQSDDILRGGGIHTFAGCVLAAPGGGPGGLAMALDEAFEAANPGNPQNGNQQGDGDA